MKFYPVYVYTNDMANYLEVECHDKICQIENLNYDPTNMKKVVLFADTPKLREDVKRYCELKAIERKEVYSES